LLKASGENVPTYGYSDAKVSSCIEISACGEITSIISLQSDDKKQSPSVLRVPYQKSRANDVFAYFMCDKMEYVFGIKAVEKKKFKEPAYVMLKETDSAMYITTPRTLKCNAEFKQMHHKLLDDAKSPEIKAFLAFVDSVNPENVLENPLIYKYINLLSANCIVFECSSKYLQDAPEVSSIWEEHSALDLTEFVTGTCMVSGDCAPISRTHSKIMGVRGSQASGALLVSFNNLAFEHYAKTQSYNAPVSDVAMFKYTTALNHLIASKNNRLNVSGDTVVFWTSEKVLENNLMNMLNCAYTKNITENEQITGQIHDIISKVKLGLPLKTTDIGLGADEKFFILGISPNNGRLAIRFWCVNTVEHFVKNIVQHHADMEIDAYGMSNQPYVSTERILRESVPDYCTEQDVSPQLKGQMFEALITNGRYPQQLYNNIILRVRIDKSINNVRAGIIKAHLLRSVRSGLCNIDKEALTVSLNEESKSVPYRLGRLFCALEHVQHSAIKGIGSDITSKYFSSAATNPASVFPYLIKHAQHHIAKSEYGERYARIIESILSEISEFPQRLTLEDQGLFMLGYYQQKKNLYTKKIIHVSEEKC